MIAWKRVALEAVARRGWSLDRRRVRSARALLASPSVRVTLAPAGPLPGDLAAAAENARRDAGVAVAVAVAIIESDRTAEMVLVTPMGNSLRHHVWRATAEPWLVGPPIWRSIGCAPIWRRPLMRPRKPHGHGALRAFIWLLNGSGAMLLLASSVRLPYAGAGAGIQLALRLSRWARLGPPATPAPTSYYLPTVTPNPLATPIEDYRHPHSVCLRRRARAARLIGYSVQGRADQVLHLWPGRATLPCRGGNPRRLRGQHHGSCQPDGRSLGGSSRDRADATPRSTSSPT